MDTWERSRPRGGNIPRVGGPLALRDSCSYPHGFPWLDPEPRKRVFDANQLMRWICRIIQMCITSSIPVLIEHPLESRAWDFPPLSKLLVEDARIDMCTCGSKWKRPTRLAFWNCHLNDRLCKPRHGICSESGRYHLRVPRRISERLPRHFATLIVDAISRTLRG